MSLELRVRIVGVSAILVARGEVDVQTAVVVKQAVDRALSSGATKLYLDLAGVTFIDSSGLGAILGRHRLVTQAGGLLALVAPTEATRRLLVATRLDQVLDILDAAPVTVPEREPDVAAGTRRHRRAG